MTVSGRRAADRVNERLVMSPFIVASAGLVGTIVAFFVVPNIHQDVEFAGPLIGLTGLLVSGIAGVAAAVQLTVGRSTHEHLLRSEHLANHDALTGLPNRTGLMDHLDRALKEMDRDNTSLGVLFLDLNRFKVVNDTMGHEAGDVLLREVAQRLAQAVRASDVVARFGGDEFVAVCGGLLTTDSLVQIARQILKSFEEPLSLDGSDMVMSTSIGIAHASKTNPRTAEELVRDADAAMYRAKRSGTGFAVFDEKQRANALSKLDTEQALRHALEAAELSVFYQPILDTNTRQLKSLEALVRWDRPGHGFVGPDLFLSVAEEAGLMIPLGDLVLREAAAQAAIWQHAYWQDTEITVSVNVAERQLIDVTFVHEVEKVLKWAGIKPESLIIEITEDTIIDHLDSALAVLHNLKALGVRLAIDDFGTGRSSLSYIKRLDMVDYLKIDKSFVDGIAESPVDRAIIEAIVKLGHAAEMTIVAEGVETTEQHQALVELGVERVQGFLFEKPLSPGQLEERFKNRMGGTAAAS